jgi:hypothetical protein
VGRAVPVGEQQGDEDEGVEKDVKHESPGHKSHGDDRVDDALALGLVGFVGKLERARLETMVLGSITLLLHMC